MASDAAMKVWREAAFAYGGQSIEGAEGETYAAAVIERAIADAVEQERAKAEALADRIEELETMYNSLGHSSLKSVTDLGTRLGTASARIERLKGYAVHDEGCEDNGVYPGSCTCGLSKLLKEMGDATCSDQPPPAA